MRLLISSDGRTAHYFIRMALGRVFTSMGHEVVMWDINKKPAMDAFDEFNPDIFWGQTYNLNGAVAQAIKERPQMKVIMKASDWGYVSDSLDRNKYPVLIAQQDEIARVLDLFNETGKPDLLQIHYHPDYIQETHSHWIKEGLKVVSFLNAADIFEFVHGKYNEAYASDIAFVGGYWPYKAKTLDRYLLPLMNPNLNLNVKIFGNQPWSIPQYCGYIGDNEVKDVLASATVCPNVSELHSQDLGYDVIERPFKLLANKCFVVSDYVEGLQKLFPTEIEYGRTPEEFHEKVLYYIKNPEERLDFIQRGYTQVIENHTYFNRVYNILIALGMDIEAKKCMDTFKAIKEKLKL